MYNESLKTKFVQGYTTSIHTARVCATIFNALEKYELEWGADICTRDKDEIQPAIDNIVGLRSCSKSLRLIILKDYVKWCMEMGVPDACDGMLKISNSGLQKMRQQMVSSPAHLNDYLNKVFEPTHEKTNDDIYRCYYWLAFAGMGEEEILRVKCTDVDFTNMIVHYEDMDFPIYREAVPAFKNCVELTQFVYKHPLYSADKITLRDRSPGDTLIRGLYALPSVKSVRVELSRRSKKKCDAGITDLRLSYYRAWLSGLFYRMYEQEQIGIEPDFDDVVSKQMENKAYKLDSGRNTRASKKRQLMRDYMEDYNRWKLAYKK